MKSQLAVICLLFGVARSLPQGGYGSQRPSTSYGATSSSSSSPGCCGGSSSGGYNSELQGSAASFGQSSFASQSFGGGFSSGGGGGQGGNLQVECRRQEVSPGRFKFVCEGVNPNSISLRSEHILWLEGPEGQKQVVDIEVPNYKIEELIKAGFKSKPGESGTLINVLLKKPEQSYDAQVDQITSIAGTPSVNLQYEPVQPVKVHFPVDKPYSPLQGPIEQPGGGRPQRQVQKTFSKPYSQVQQVQVAPPAQQQGQQVQLQIHARQ